jgi:hypothetical protein
MKTGHLLLVDDDRHVLDSMAGGSSSFSASAPMIACGLPAPAATGIRAAARSSGS